MMNFEIYRLTHKYNYDVEKYRKVKSDFQDFHNTIKDNTSKNLKNELSSLYSPSTESHYDNFMLLIDELILPNENYSAEDIQKLQFASKECIGKYFDTLKRKRKGKNRRYSHIIAAKYTRFSSPFSTNNIQNLFDYIGSILGSALLLILAFALNILISGSWQNALSWLGLAPGLQLIVFLSVISIISLLLLYCCKHFVMRLLSARFAVRRKNPTEESTFVQVAIVVVSAAVSFCMFVLGQIMQSIK